jgi:hypothetical protein
LKSSLVDNISLTPSECNRAPATKHGPLGLHFSQ